MPRAGLSAARVLEEAEQVADEVGLGNLTLAAVAGRLGVRLPSLYKHVAGLDGLHRSLAVRAKTELGDVLGRACVGLARDDAVGALALAYRAWAHAHPGRYAATLRAPLAGDEDDRAASAVAVQVVADVLRGYQLEGRDAIDAIRGLRAALHGFVTLEQAGGFGLPVDVDRSYLRLVGSLCIAFRTGLPA